MGDRDDVDNLSRIIKAVQFEYQDDDGKWIDHNSGEWVKTGQTEALSKDEVLNIDIEPPIEAYKVRVVMDFNPEHYSKPSRLVYTVKGRFDFQVS